MKTPRELAQELLTRLNRIAQSDPQIEYDYGLPLHSPHENEEMTLAVLDFLREVSHADLAHFASRYVVHMSPDPNDPCIRVTCR
jgi:hypothetical protein